MSIVIKHREHNDVDLLIAQTATAKKLAPENFGIVGYSQGKWHFTFSEFEEIFLRTTTIRRVRQCIAPTFFCLLL